MGKLSIFLKFLISSFILVCSNSYGQTSNIQEQLETFNSQVWEIMFPVFILMVLMLVVKIIVTGYIKKDEHQEYHLSRKDFEKSLNTPNL